MKAHLSWFTIATLVWLSRASPEIELPPWPDLEGITEAYVDCTNTTGLTVHILHAGCDASRSNPLIVLIHGFPGISYTWRHVMPALAAEGYCVVAYDRRGCGRTTGWDTRPWGQVDFQEFSKTNAVRDLVALVYGLGYTKARAVIGHDFGGTTAAWAGLTRPDMFGSSVHIGYPLVQPPLPTYPAPTYKFEPILETSTQPTTIEIAEAGLEKLYPARTYYQLFLGGPTARDDWLSGGPLSFRQFLRAYFYLHSADYPGNHPHPLESYAPEQLAMIPYYFIMLKNQTFSKSVAYLTAGLDTSVSKSWMPDIQLNLYADEYVRVNFQGELNTYRILTAPPYENPEDNWIFSGRKIEVPVIFIGGEKDWARYLDPGALENYPRLCTDYRGQYTVPNSGHWVQLEQPRALVEILTGFLNQLRNTVERSY